MNIKPLHDHVIVSRLESEEKTPGGIIIPDTAKEKPQEGKVLAVGPGRLDKEGNRITPEVKEGDKVLFTKWGGTEVKIDGRELMIMKEDDILAVLE
ncbi:MAG TPA: co-chaperone GroES [Smithellaceae bacterium]|jgi:chaperonin GroES|nr:MAG: 10 kDa chaperonin [Deltaproteobacteria bacterium ADurb.BinA014]HNQ18440.1 co-chaperone GroES [Smithellaceae bacterium]HNT91015.1 co-chaperone GroES [Smithellaceae bacterium]HNV64383.1 co-chaperone GroES [Smithellaceae bacterium]HNZ32093.1 co-chaperone GroES [Smithellaceae bacterium]